MNEVTQVRMNNWAIMVKQRSNSGMTVKEWCAENGISESTYYYRVNCLRKHMMGSSAADWGTDASGNVVGQFVMIPASGNTSGSSIADLPR